MWQWTINDFEVGRPLLEVIALRIPAAPAGLLRQLLRKGRIGYGGGTVSNEPIVVAGLPIAIRPSARLDELVAAGGLNPDMLLFEDRHSLVVAKPAGLAVHRASGVEEHLQGRVARFLAWRQAPYQGRPVHRLDIGTSGPVLFAKGRHAAGAYGRKLMAGHFTKRYLALVVGEVPGSGELTTPVPDGGRDKTALTRYRRLAAAGRYCLLDLELVTGRTHQARRQLADAGWPIVNDRRYGGTTVGTEAHPWLHCRQLIFPDLDSDARHTVAAPLPATLVESLRKLGLDLPLPADNISGNFLLSGSIERL